MPFQEFPQYVVWVETISNYDDYGHIERVNGATTSSDTGASAYCCRDSGVINAIWWLNPPSG